MRITAHEIPILDRVYMAVSLLKDFQRYGEPKSCTRVRTTTLTYIKPQIANCIFAGQSTGTNSAGNAFLPGGTDGAVARLAAAKLCGRSVCQIVPLRFSFDLVDGNSTTP
jgi:hypothetical protein